MKKCKLSKLGDPTLKIKNVENRTINKIEVGFLDLNFCVFQFIWLIVGLMVFQTVHKKQI